MKTLHCFLLVLHAAAAYAGSEQLVYGRIVNADSSGMIVYCEGARHSHPTGYYGISDSPNELVVHVSGDGDALNVVGKAGLKFLTSRHSDEFTVVLFMAQPEGTFTYTTKAGIQSKVPNLVKAEALPPFSVVTPTQRGEGSITAR